MLNLKRLKEKSHWGAIIGKHLNLSGYNINLTPKVIDGLKFPPK